MEAENINKPQNPALQQGVVIGRFFRVDGWGKQIHLCTGTRPQPICGTHLNFPEKGMEVKYFDGELKEHWGDGTIQPFKWVKVDEYRYCKRCLGALAKTCL